MDGKSIGAIRYVKIAKLYRFFLEGVRFEGSVLQGYNGRIFSAARLPSDSPNFFIFLEGVSFSGVFVTYIRWRIFFYDPRHRQNRQTSEFIFGRVKF